MKIEERAADYACNWSNCQDGRDDLLQCAVESYKQGATDQRKIDIDKACEWLINNCNGLVSISGVSGTIYPFIESFRKAMKE